VSESGGQDGGGKEKKEVARVSRTKGLKKDTNERGGEKNLPLEDFPVDEKRKKNDEKKKKELTASPAGGGKIHGGDEKRSVLGKAVAGKIKKKHQTQEKKKIVGVHEKVRDGH